MRVCFDNEIDFWGLDRIATMDVNYTAMYSRKTSFAEDVCPVPFGPTTTESSLPVVTFSNDLGFYLFDQLDQTFSAVIPKEETLYFHAGDSIFVKIQALANAEEDCFAATLISNTDSLIAGTNIDWLDRVYYLENENSGNTDFEITLVLPTDAASGWDNGGLKTLYTDEAVSPGSNPDWEINDVISVNVNNDFAYVQLPYMGIGSYAVGGVEPTAVDNINFQFEFDEIQYFDIMGRKAAIDETVRSNSYPSNIYFKVFLKKGVIVKTKTIVN